MYYFHSPGSHLVLSKLLRTVGSSLDSLIYDLLEARVLEADKSSVSSAVGAGDVLSQLRGLIRGLNKHLSSTEAGLCSETSSLLLGESETDTAGDKMLDESEEVSGARA